MTGLTPAQPLIVGAGPTGLAAALFLAERGIAARLVDQAPTPNRNSRAQVVNPRALDLLEPNGVAARIVAEGRPINGVRFYEDWKPLATLHFRDLPSRHAMTVLPQARTEALLADALEKRGGRAERGVGLAGLTQTDAAVAAQLRHDDDRIEAAEAPLLLGADGAHSRVRDALGIGFTGDGFPEPWPLYDIALDDPLSLDEAHVSFVDGGLVFLLAIEPGLWRVFGNTPDPLALLPQGTHIGEATWQSSFHIGDKLADRLVEGRVVLAGDAAHIHSPVGARGMNLGIEDAYVFAACAADTLAGQPDRLADYQRLRHPIHARVVSRMGRLTALARGKPGWVGLLRHYAIPALTDWGPLAHTMQSFITGLDEPAAVR